MNSNSIEKNGMQIGGEDIENLFMNVILETKKIKTHISMQLYWAWVKQNLGYNLVGWNIMGPCS